MIWSALKGNFQRISGNDLSATIGYNYLRDRSRLVKIPRALNNLYLKINKQRKLNPGIGINDLAKLLEVTPEKIQEVDQATQVIHSLDFEGQNDEDGNMGHWQV